MRISVKAAALVGGLILVAWVGSLTPDLLRTYAPASDLRVALLGKPLATLRFGETWSLALNKSGEGQYPPWLDQFDTHREGVNLQTLFDEAESFVVVHPNRTARFVEDDLTRALKIGDALQNLQISPDALLVRDISWRHTSWSWPFLHLRNRRYVIVFSDEQFAKYDPGCQADLVTAWAIPKSDAHEAVEARCGLDG